MLQREETKANERADYFIITPFMRASYECLEAIDESFFALYLKEQETDGKAIFLNCD